MEIRYRPRFFREYKKLPLEVRRLAEKRTALFRKNPYDFRPKTHKLHGDLAGFHAFWVEKKNHNHLTECIAWQPNRPLSEPQHQLLGNRIYF